MTILLPTEKNIKSYAVENYVNKACLTAEEFWEDYNRIKYIKRLLGRYVKQGELKERLILNHLIVVFNMFGIEAALEILNLKLEDRHWPVIKPFLLFLRYIKNDQYTGITMDPTVVEVLRKI